jgi:hypothetical protein
LSHSGNRVILRFLPSGPTKAVRSSSDSVADSGGCSALTKSEKLGPALSLLLNDVVGLELGLSGEGKVSVVVARVRLKVCEDEEGQARQV